MRKKATIADRFWPKVDRRAPDECWPWTASKYKNGYGQIGVGGRDMGVTGAHRVAWELTHGAVPDGFFVCHRCDNPGCVNPNHLFVAAPKANTWDMIEKGRSRLKGLRFRHSRELLLRVATADIPNGKKSIFCREVGISRHWFDEVRKRYVDGTLQLPPA